MFFKKSKTCFVTFVDFGCSPPPIAPPAGTIQGLVHVDIMNV